MVTNKKPSIYDKVDSLVVKRIDERIPFKCFGEVIDWDGVYEEMKKIKSRQERYGDKYE